MEHSIHTDEMVNTKAGGNNMNVCVWEKEQMSETTNCGRQGNRMEGASEEIVWKLIIKDLEWQDR